jgi:hypothetical protein
MGEAWAGSRTLTWLPLLVSHPPLNLARAGSGAASQGGRNVPALLAEGLAVSVTVAGHGGTRTRTTTSAGPTLRISRYAGSS